MAFNFGASKGVTGFTLPTSSATTAPLNFGGASGDTQQAKTLFGTQPTPAVTSSISFGGAPTSAFATTAATTTSAPLSFSLATTTGPVAGFGGASFLTTTAPSTGTLSYGLLGTTTKPASLTTLVTSAAPSLVTTTAATVPVLPSTGALTFSQLEDAINKWTLDLEEQGKVFANQAKHLNAWDRLLIGNGEKILNVSSGIERIKQQQQKLDQDLDFVLAQQNELEDCIAPLEKELQDVPIVDTERDQTYKLAEDIDTQLKQMSEDLKEIIEHLNESNKAQELSDPVAQIGRILSAHMNSLQWIDRSTSQISSQLDMISKMQDLNKKKSDTFVMQTYPL